VSKADQPTVRAVLKYAEQLRQRASRECLLDPYADPYAPSEAAARKVFQGLAAQIRRRAADAGIERPEEEIAGEAATAAIQELASRVVMRERETRHQREAAQRAERRHARRQRQARAEEQARLAGITLGDRLDRAMRDIEMLSEVRATALDADRITRSREQGLPSLPRPADRYQTLLQDARELVFRLEEELDHARRRKLKEPA
jgi:hypothetical protein